jgi:CheY-like chemotaxis protein
MIRILLVEDNDDDADIVSRVLHGKKGWVVVRALSVKEAMLHAALKPFDVAIVDYQLPDGDGVDLLDSLRAQAPGLPVLFLTAHGSEEVAMQAMSRGASDYMVKQPHYQRELPSRLEEVLSRAEDIARVAAAVKHSGDAAPVPGKAVQKQAPRPANGYDPKVLARVIKNVVGKECLGAAVFDAQGRPLAAKLPQGVEPDALGASLIGTQFQAQQALQRVPGAGPPRCVLVEYEGGLVAVASVPGPALVVLLLEASADRTAASKLVRDAAQQVWDSNKA